MKLPLATLAALSAMVLSACGFSPLHATPGGTAAFSNVGLSVLDGQSEQDRAAGFQFAQHMRARIGETDTPTYTLRVTPSVSRIDLGLTAQDRASRFDRRFSAGWVLADARTGAVIAKGRASDTTTFTGDLDPYRLASNDDQSTQRVTRSVADKMLTDVAIALQGEALKPVAPSPSSPSPLPSATP